MPNGHASALVDLDRIYHILISVLGAALVVLSLVGEYRGWWNDLG